jgi:hypothetical protein
MFIYKWIALKEMHHHGQKKGEDIYVYIHMYLLMCMYLYIYICTYIASLWPKV